MKLKGIKRKTVIILLSVFMVAFVMICSVFGCWLKYLQPYRKGIEYYSSGSYSKFGFGFYRYGKIASEYFPEYNDVVENSVYAEFVYSGGSGYTKTVDVFVAVKYDEETYATKREEILQIGEDFGADYHIGDIELRHHRLIEERRMINGDYVYYVISCCDKDNGIMYSVMFDNREHTDMGSLSIHSHPYYDFFREFHTECISLNTY